MPQFDLKIVKPSGAVTGQMGECVEIQLDRSRLGHISFVRHGKSLLEIIDGSLEAPTFALARTRAPASSAQGEDDEVEPEEATPNPDEEDEEEADEEQEAARLAAEEAQREAARQRAIELVRQVRAKQVAITQRLFGQDVRVNFQLSHTVIETGDGDTIAEGSTWEQAFRRAMRSSGVWELALRMLCKQQKSDAYVPRRKMTRSGYEQLRGMPGADEVDVEVALNEGQIEVVPSILLKRAS